MPGELTIRAAAVDDCARIAEIYNGGIQERTSTFETRRREAADIAAWLDDFRRFPVLVAVMDGGVVGWARVARYSEREAYRGVGECQVYVDPSVRGRGVGSRLLADLCREAGMSGYWKLVGRLFTSNEASRALVRRCGFREVGVHERHARLDGQWRAVLVVEGALEGSEEHEGEWVASEGPVRVRPGRSSEIPSVLSLWREAEALPSATDSPAALAALLERDAESLLVAEVDGELVGVVIATWDGWRGNLYRLAVTASYHRRGVGRTLVAVAERRLAERGAARVSALVRDHPPAREFWRAGSYAEDAQVTRFVKTLGE